MAQYSDRFARRDKRRVGLLFRNYGPYHAVRWQHAAKLFSHLGGEVIPIQLLSKDPDYGWDSADAIRQYSVPIVTVLDRCCSGTSLRASARLWYTLDHLDLQGLAIAGYGDSMGICALLWAKANRRATVLMSDSKADDKTRNWTIETVKKVLVGFHGAALVAGTPQRDYLVHLGIPPRRVFDGYDVVDNAYFQVRSDDARGSPHSWQAKLALPELPFFLCVSRFVAKKNLIWLLEVYSDYVTQTEAMGTSSIWDLVLVGGGPMRSRIESRAEELGLGARIHIHGFRQQKDLAAYYALCGAAVFPSNHSEQWGLVVNEAMASATPVLVSKRMGCCTDLVDHGCTGYSFDPDDRPALVALMRQLHDATFADRRKMGTEARLAISSWGPERFAASLEQAFAAAGLLPWN